MIINLPSVEVPSAGTLTMLVTHRFVGPSPGRQHRQLLHARHRQHLGLRALVRARQEPERRLLPDLGPQYLRSVRGISAAHVLRIHVVAARRRGLAHAGRRRDPQVEFLRAGDPGVLLRAVRPAHRRADVSPADQRPQRALQDFPVPGDQSCVFKEALRRRIGARDSTKTSFNIPVGASIAITHSITVHGEVIPALSKVHSKGVGWSVSVEKSLLRHRFAFYAGNQRQTTVDRYVQAVPAYPPSSARRTSSSASTCSGRGT